MTVRHGFWRSLRHTLSLILRDKAMILMLIVAPVMYGFYYPWPYQNQIIRQTPIGVIDLNHSAVSRQIIRYAAASPYIRPVPFANPRAAHAALAAGDIGGYLILPADLERRIYLNQPVTVPVNATGAYLLIGKAALTGVIGSVRTVAAGIELKRFAAQGLSVEQANALRDPVPLSMTLLYNPNEGYGNYVVPAVAWLILQQTLLIGTALLIGTLFENKQVYATPSAWAGRITALSLINMLMCYFYTGWVFHLQGYTAGGNPLGNALLILCFSPCVATLGCLLGLWFKERERSLQILTFSSLPLYFMSGYSWPQEALPPLFRYLRWLIPDTSAIQAGVHFNQMNAPLIPNLPYLCALILLGITAFLILIYTGRFRVAGKNGRQP